MLYNDQPPGHGAERHAKVADLGQYGTHSTATAGAPLRRRPTATGISCRRRSVRCASPSTATAASSRFASTAGGPKAGATRSAARTRPRSSANTSRASAASSSSRSHPYGTDFQLRVWRALRAIPYGAVRNYGDIARAIGQPGARTRRRPSERPQPAADRDPVPPRDRERRHDRRLLRRPRDQAPLARARRRRARPLAMAHELRCCRCGESLATLSLPLARLDECPKCHVHLHVCRMCERYRAAKTEGLQRGRRDRGSRQEGRELLRLLQAEPARVQPRRAASRDRGALGSWTDFSRNSELRHVTSLNWNTRMRPGRYASMRSPGLRGSSRGGFRHVCQAQARSRRRCCWSACDAAAVAADFYVEITNNTGYTIMYMYVSPAKAESWEEDVLGDDMLASGETQPREPDRLQEPDVRHPPRRRGRRQVHVLERRRVEGRHHRHARRLTTTTTSVKQRAQRSRLAAHVDRLEPDRPAPHRVHVVEHALRAL